MKIRISYPKNNTCKVVEIDNDNKLQSLIGKNIGNIFMGDEIGDEFKGYVFRITGGCDKQGFPMRKGIMINRRVKLLIKPGSTGYQAWRAPRKGTRRRKSVRGAIVDLDLSVLECIIVRKGEKELEGITTKVHKIQRGPLRAKKIKKLFDLEDDFDLTKFLPIYKKKEFKNGWTLIKKPRIQRLLTPRKIRRRTLRNKQKLQRRLRTKQRKEEYKQLLSKGQSKKH